MDRDKELEIGETELDTFEVMTSTGKQFVTVYYGNIIIPAIDNLKFLPIEQYLDILADFLRNYRGHRYRIPSPQEVEKAMMEGYERFIVK